jgi:hypothetical protein
MVLDPARLHSALDAIADLFASCESPDAEILAAEQVQLFTALCRTGAVVAPSDLPRALQAPWQQAPELPIPDPDEPDVFDVPDPVPGSPRRGRLYLAVDNTGSTGAVVAPSDLPRALQALWQQAPELPIPDPDEPDVFDVPDPVPGSPRRGRLYLAVDNTGSTGAAPHTAADQVDSSAQSPAVGDTGPPPTGAP